MTFFKLSNARRPFSIATEIDEISHREVAKQRAHALAERAKLEKDVKKTASKAHARKESTEAADVSKSPAKEAITTLAAPATGNGDAVMSDIDEQLQVRSRPSRCDSFPPSSGSQCVCMLT